MPHKMAMRIAYLMQSQTHARSQRIGPLIGLKMAVERLHYQIGKRSNVHFNYAKSGAYGSVKRSLIKSCHDSISEMKQICEAMVKLNTPVPVLVWFAAFSWLHTGRCHPTPSLVTSTSLRLTSSSSVASLASSSLSSSATPSLNRGDHLVQHVVRGLRGCNLKEPHSLRRVFLKNQSITCNDGSPAGYYIRKSYGSKRWIVFLEGGWYCFDRQSCIKRWHHSSNLMSSKSWPDTRHVGGFLSSDPQENPHWWNANHVFVPYCSSDAWSGAAFPYASSRFSFLGSLIVGEVIKDLLPQGLLAARHLFLAGSSAGGTGVLLNLDRVADTLRSLGAAVQVRGVADSGWFLDNDPFAPAECTDSLTCTPVEAIKQGIALWNGQVPEQCAQQQLPSEIWKCYFGYRIYPTMRAPLFIFQWLFDQAQLTADNVGHPITKAQWDYIHEVGDHLRQTLRNVTDWAFVKVNHMTLPEALKCWVDQDEIPEPKNRPKPVSQESPQCSTAHHRYHSEKHRAFRKRGETYMLSDAPESAHLKHSHRQRTSAVSGSETAAITEASPAAKNSAMVNETLGTNQRFKNRRRRRKGKKKNRRRHKKENVREMQTWDGTTNHTPSPCRFHLMDECTWPQCNRACPKLINPYTGEEMDFIELLKSLGLDMSSVAMALGLDLEALNAMGNDRLLQILTQHS